jgi:hypothetical protein
VSAVFADSWYYIALLDASDAHHPAVRRHADQFDGEIVTTRWVLAEVANSLAGPRFRTMVAKFLRDVEADPNARVIGPSDELYGRGLSLYEERPDKYWSLTDCISFVVMDGEGVREALTNDRHFGQAGFRALFAE